MPVQYLSRDEYRPSPSGTYDKMRSDAARSLRPRVMSGASPHAGTTGPAARAAVPDRVPLPDPSGDPGLPGEPVRRDSFVSFDAWGRVAGMTHETLARASSGVWQYRDPFSREFVIDALGRRVAEKTVDRQGESATTLLAYDLAGNVVEGQV